MLDQLRSSATITDLQLVQAIANLRTFMLPGNYYSWVNLYTVSEFLDINPNRVRSKFRRAHKRKLVDGCNCGCRGDLVLLPAGEKLLREWPITNNTYRVIN